MQSCTVCNKRLTTAKAILAGMGKTCSRRHNSGEVGPPGPRPRVELLNRYRDGSRSWLVFTNPRVVVRITPEDEQMESYRCDFGNQCEDDRCEHKEAVRAKEREILAGRRAA